MRPFFLRGFVCSAVLNIAPHLSAQAGGTGVAPPAAVSADEEWASLKNLATPKPLTPPPSRDAASLNQARQQAIAGLIADADRLKSFYTKNPTHGEATEAKRLEALTLVRASMLGDTSQESRRKQLVSEVRKDTSIPIPARAQVAALADHVEVGQRTDLSHVEKVAAYEQVVRSLIVEFPTMPDGYEALVHVANDSPDAKAQSIARDVLGMPASLGVKAAAQVLLNRFALVGQSLPDLARPILGKNNAVDRANGKPVVVYSWATFSKGSLAMARDLAAKAPKGAALVGVCLDVRDLTPAKQLAAAQHLPGEQVYDWFGRRGELAERLALTAPGVVYIADTKGVIRSVSAQHDLPAALKALP